MLERAQTASWMPRRLSAPKDRVALWLIDNVASSPLSPAIKDELSADEVARLQRFVYDEDRRRFGTTRLALRRLLGEAAGLPPNAIVFGEEPRGKPTALNLAGWRFNVSHSANRAVIAIRRDGPIGVDIEHARADVDGIGLAELFFSPKERQIVAASILPRHAFYRIWTAKEAVLKAFGLGITDHLRDFSILPHDDTFQIDFEPELEEKVSPGVTVHPLSLSPDYVGAYAIPVA